ncbi:hypothetical protein [Streptomyces stelliscabiei]|uniref:hypothetical protein n=1 Tax=Streptomyces stelliscabiei TaxID=146820 RepID=UPI0029AB31D4|nr:hypothetical protein [Streptomyces stelliscabiei]MDX2660436.1 hypothetical protein [Streptomyces stelliscabiei]MDX3442841.1 hypothetical protein [Streptomyces stelliscabiei]
MRGNDDGRVGGVRGVGEFVDEGDREVTDRLVRSPPRPGCRRTATAANTVHMDAVRPSRLRVWLEGGAAALG